VNETDSTGPVPISVVIPVYHAAERHLRKLASSLATQGAAEVIVVLDDDSSPELVAALLAAVPNLTVMVSDGQGAGMARNRGAAAATQEWITFLDHDDWWPSGFLTTLLGEAEGDVVGYDNEVFLEEDDVDAEPLPAGETLFDRADWEHSSIDADAGEMLLDRFPLVKLLIRRRAFVAVGGFRSIYAVEDFDLVWRLVAAGHRIDLPRRPIGAYLVHASSTTGSVNVDRAAFERAQRSWVRIWSGMARSRGLPAGVRIGAARNAAKVSARIVARRVRDRLRGR
jgi:glycosyltransferase involved in cell wall biosynthesis